MAEGVVRQRLLTLVTFTIPCIPLGSDDASLLKPPVGFGWELGPNSTWGADHSLHLKVFV